MTFIGKGPSIGTVGGFNLLDWVIVRIGAISGVGLLVMLIVYLFTPSEINIEMLFIISFILIISINYFIVKRILRKKIKNLDMVLNGIYIVLAIFLILIFTGKNISILKRLFWLLLNSLLFIGLSIIFVYLKKK